MTDPSLVKQFKVTIPQGKENYISNIWNDDYGIFSNNTAFLIPFAVGVGGLKCKDLIIKSEG